MKAKNYEQKKRDLKKQKKEGLKREFQNTRERKKFVDGIKTSFRSLKRSEKQVLQKEIMDRALGLDDESFDELG
jgi:hypothetical protein